MKTSTKAARAALAAALCAGALAARAAPSCAVVTAPGCIDTRDAAPSGAGAAIVVETRPGDTVATVPGDIDAATGLAFVIVVR